MNKFKIFLLFYFIIIAVSNIFGSDKEKKLNLRVFIDDKTISIGAIAGFLPIIRYNYNSKLGFCKSDVIDTNDVTSCEALTHNLIRIHERFKKSAPDIDTMQYYISETLFNKINTEIKDITIEAGFKEIIIRKMDEKSIKKLNQKGNKSNYNKCTIRYNEKKDIYSLDFQK